jgi:DNA-directed RNA polymerase specialized sigma24 family protein
MYHSNLSRHDEERLVACCLKGDHESWEIMYGLYHPRLVSTIRVLMRGASGTGQAEDIAAEVWSLLWVEPNKRLKRYNPQAGRLLSFLTAMARRELTKERRSTQRRHFRECIAARKESSSEEVGHRIAFNEFLATLTGRELEFCLSELRPKTDRSHRPPLSVENVWKLRSRVMKKFRKYYLEGKLV